MKQFTKQLLFILIGVAVITAGGLAIWAATVGGGLKVNPILGHDLDLNALYYGQAANNTG